MTAFGNFLNIIYHIRLKAWTCRSSKLVKKLLVDKRFIFMLLLWSTNKIQGVFLPEKKMKEISFTRKKLFKGNV